MNIQPKKYQKAVVVAGVVIKKGNKYLLMQEKKIYARDLWNLPAGRIEVGMSIRNTAIQEALEETGYHIKLLKQVDIFHSDGDAAVKHAFLGRIKGKQGKYNTKEIQAVRWFTFQQINKMKAKLRKPWLWILESITIVEKGKV